MSATTTGARSALRPETVRALTAPRSRVDRVRARATTAAATGIGVVLLVAGAAATVRDTVPVGTSVWTDAAGVEHSEELFQADGALAPFLAEPGLRSGYVVAAVLLVLPFLALAVQALRVGQVVEEHRARRLLVAGATWADLRRLRTARTAAAFWRGGLLAGPAYLLLWCLLGLALPAGHRLLPPLHWALPLVWVAAVALLQGFARALAVLGFRHQDVLVWQRAGVPDRVPSRGFVVGTAVGGAALVLATPVAGGHESVFTALLVVALVLFLLAAGAGSARSAAGGVRGRAAADPTGPAAGPAGRVSRRAPRSRDVAVGLLADAQRRGSSAALTGTAGVLFVCGLSFGVEAALVGGVLADRNYTADDLAFYLGGTALAAAVGVAGALVAVAALVLSLTDHLLGNRRAVASTAALGVEPRRLVAVQAVALARTAVPVTSLGVLVAALPYTLTSGGGDGPWRWTALLPLGVAVVVAVAVTAACWALAFAVRGRVRAAAALENLRVP